MEKLKRTLPNGYAVELFQNTTEELIYEIWEEKCYAKHYTLKRGDTVLDIGANQGIFSLYAAYHGAEVHAFEPNAIALT